MRAVSYSPMLTFDSGAHQEVKPSRGVANLMQSEQKVYHFSPSHTLPPQIVTH